MSNLIWYQVASLQHKLASPLIEKIFYEAIAPCDAVSHPFINGDIIHDKWCGVSWNTESRNMIVKREGYDNETAANVLTEEFTYLCELMKFSSCTKTKNLHQDFVEIGIFSGIVLLCLPNKSLDEYI